MLCQTESVQSHGYEDKTKHLLAAITLHSVGLMLSGMSNTPNRGARVSDHFLGKCGVGLLVRTQFGDLLPASVSALLKWHALPAIYRQHGIGAVTDQCSDTTTGRVIFY